jgi:hypothetical protein
LVQVAAAIIGEKLRAAKETTVPSDEVLDADEGLDGAGEASDAALDADDEPLRPTNRGDMMGTEPTAALILPSSDNFSANAHLLEAYLVEDNEEETIPIYDATPELPWWKQRCFRVIILLMCILISSMAALLGVFLAPASSSISLEATTSSAPSSAPSTSLFPSLNPHTSPKVSLLCLKNGLTGL